MKRRIEELLNDTYRYQAPKLVLSEEHLELMAPADSSLEGEFFSWPVTTVVSGGC